MEREARDRDRDFQGGEDTSERERSINNTSHEDGQAREGEREKQDSLSLASLSLEKVTPFGEPPSNKVLASR
jgi:hypothetical protein